MPQSETMVCSYCNSWKQQELTVCIEELAEQAAHFRWFFKWSKMPGLRNSSQAACRDVGAHEFRLSSRNRGILLASDDQRWNVDGFEGRHGIWAFRHTLLNLADI